MLSPSDQKMVTDVARHGWHLIGVPTDAEGPGFAYSVGLRQTFAHPEVILFGLGIETMWRVINTIGDQVRGGRPFREAGLYEGLITGFACKIIPVADRHRDAHFGCALWYASHVGTAGSLEAVQCLWPDKAGVFPDEPGCDPAIGALQPLLDRDP